MTSQPLAQLEQIIADMPKRCAVAKLVGFCEGILKSGLLGEGVGAKFREVINETNAAFDMRPTKERV